jgi:hypothetical protein
MASQLKQKLSVTRRLLACCCHAAAHSPYDYLFCIDESAEYELRAFR